MKEQNYSIAARYQRFHTCKHTHTHTPTYFQPIWFTSIFHNHSCWHFSFSLSRCCFLFGLCAAFSCFPESCSICAALQTDSQHKILWHRHVIATINAYLHRFIIDVLGELHTAHRKQRETTSNRNNNRKKRAVVLFTINHHLTTIY